MFSRKQGSQVDSDHSRIRLLRDVVFFQFKLAADGLRDILLSPVSIVAAILGLVFEANEPDKYFRRLLRFGQQSDVWINLFSQYRDGPTADRFIEPLEQKVIKEYERGGWLQDGTRKVNDALDSVKLSKAGQPRKKSGSPDRQQPGEPPPDKDS